MRKAFRNRTHLARHDGSWSPRPNLLADLFGICNGLAIATIGAVAFNPRTGLLALGALAAPLALYSHAIWSSPGFGFLADQPVHLELSRAFAESLADGAIPPSWAGSLSGGRGGPAFVLYPPLFFLLTAAFMSVTPSAPDALGWALIASVVWIFGGAYYLARAGLSVRRSLLAATLTTLLPGVTLTGWGRGLLPCFLALGWSAFLFGAAARLLSGQAVIRDGAALSLSLAGLLLTHVLTSVMTAVLVVASLPAVWRRLSARKVGVGLTAAALALLGTAWYWLPMWAAIGRVQTAYLAEIHPYETSLLFGPSRGIDAYSRSWEELNEFGLIVAGAQLALACGVLLALRGQPRGIFVAALPYIAGFVALATVYPFGAGLAKTPGLQYLQFSWRWQGPFALWCAVGLATIPRARILAPGLFCGAVIVLFLPLLSPADRPPPNPRALSANPLTPEQYEEIAPGPRALYVSNLIEMRPRGAPPLRYPPAPYGAVEVIAGKADIQPLRLNQTSREYRVSSAGGATLRLRVYHLPGWEARWDGHLVPISAEPSTQLQITTVPPGEGRLQLQFSRRALLEELWGRNRGD